MAEKLDPRETVTIAGLTIAKEEIRVKSCNMTSTSNEKLA